MAKGGARPGAGRPKGKLNPETLDRIKVNEALRQRTMRVAERLLERQLSVAVGQSFLYRIDKYYVSTSAKSGYWRAKAPVIEEDAEVIAAFLDGQFEDRSDTEGSASYYFITTKEPNTRAIENMLDRALGGAPKALEITSPDGSLKSVVIIRNEPKRGDKSTTKAD